MEGFSKKKELSSRRRLRIESILDGQEQPLKNILQKLSLSIESGDYNVVFGLDASARIPALLLGGVIKKRYNELGYGLPSIRFIAGMQKEKVNKESELNKTNELDDYLKKLIDGGVLRGDKKVIVVEDTAITGESIKFLTEALKNNNILYDIAIVAGGEGDSAIWSERLDANVAVGSFDEATVYGKRDLSGVIKQHEMLFAHRRDSNEGNIVMAAARKYINTQIEELNSWYLDELLRSSDDSS